MNATDSEERMREGFAALLETLHANMAEAPSQTIRKNTEAREREQNRVWREYQDYGLIPPSDLALSITARLDLGMAVVAKPAQREAAE